MEFKDIAILLVCNLGASTGVMVHKMKEVVENSEQLKNNNITIQARPVAELKDHIATTSVVLVGPQMKHNFDAINEVASEYDVPCEVIDSAAYGLADGAKILKQGLYLYSQKAKGK